MSTGIAAVGRTAFAIAVDDLEKFRAEGSEAGLEPAKIVDCGFVRMVGGKDPDGKDVSALFQAGAPV